MRAAAVIAIFAASAMAQTGGSASPTTGTNGTHTGAPTTAPTSGANSLSQNIFLGSYFSAENENNMKATFE
ncbi:hypothetical protein BBK36DRAFT_1163038 [Trichoderma citrinoviride]|uniref:Uncharacterized protein n=1 Tax=Trichoderma citrinoviride TaxID=58853 RepID=A0A2T4AZ59_9HYPO|nr:hypothetical protein BBK36DRAFT_1163038 [Trichoderma citrinoviride]PTB62357.1 hypothetical protein BBK36DRAFT_1163038 [Trichoderma citrinoviride]